MGRVLVRRPPFLTLARLTVGIVIGSHAFLSFVVSDNCYAESCGAGSSASVACLQVSTALGVVRSLLSVVR